MQRKRLEVTTIRLQPWQREAVRRLGGSSFIRAAIAAAIEDALRNGTLPFAFLVPLGHNMTGADMPAQSALGSSRLEGTQEPENRNEIVER
jgi:hypothetical protein